MGECWLETDPRPDSHRVNVAAKVSKGPEPRPATAGAPKTAESPETGSWWRRIFGS